MDGQNDREAPGEPHHLPKKSSAVNGVLQLRAGAELRRRCTDLHRLARLRIAAFARRGVDGREFVEAGEFDVVVGRELSGDLRDRRVHRRLPLTQLESGPLGYLRYRRLPSIPPRFRGVPELRPPGQHIGE